MRRKAEMVGYLNTEVFCDRCGRQVQKAGEHDGAGKASFMGQIVDCMELTGREWRTKAEKAMFADVEVRMEWRDNYRRLHMVELCPGCADEAWKMVDGFVNDPALKPGANP